MRAPAGRNTVLQLAAKVRSQAEGIHFHLWVWTAVPSPAFKRAGSCFCQFWILELVFKKKKREEKWISKTKSLVTALFF